MIQFFVALFVFMALHILPAATGLRSTLISFLGRPLYIGLYSTVSLLTLVWLILAALEAPYVALWPTTPTTALVPMIAMIPACLLFAAGATRPNPLSVSFVGGEIDSNRAGILALVRHPILWAFFLWSSSHAIANGDLVALIMFGGFAVFSLVGMHLLERRARRRMTPRDFDAAMAVSRGGLGHRLRRSWAGRTAAELACGIVLYVMLLELHGPVIGIDSLVYL